MHIEYFAFISVAAAAMYGYIQRNKRRREDQRDRDELRRRYQ